MTEKEAVLAYVIKHLMDKADAWRKIDSVQCFEDTQRLVNASQWDIAAIEVAGLGVSSSIIDSAVGRYLNQIKNPHFQCGYMHLAVAMAKQGATCVVLEKVIKALVKNYCHSWTLTYLEELTVLVGRKPTKQEVFALIELEKTNMISMHGGFHEELITFAQKYLHSIDVEIVREKLKGKVEQFNSMGDW